MSKVSITILCPSGHRRKVQVTPNSNLLQILEDMCVQENLDSAEWGLVHQRKKCDLTIPWRLAAIPTNALLEMYKLDERRPETNVTIQLQLPDNSRYSGSFKPSRTLQEMLDWYRNQSENSSIVAFDNSSKGENVQPSCSYMSEDVCGEYALSNTTIRELGLTCGTAVIRYQYRSISEDELKKITERIDTKLARRQQKTTKPVSDPTPPPPPPPPPTTTVSNFQLPPPPPQPVVNPVIPSFNNEEFSIFRDIPVSHPTTTNQQQQSRTLAEALGINISLNTPSPFRQQPQNDFNNFKFPEATKGQDLSQTSTDSRSAHDSKSCDRQTIAYNLAETPSTQTEELPDSFFELTPDDLRSVLNSLKQQGSDENPLETRLMRERAQIARQNAYEYIVIRLVLNSNNILQGLFYPQEPLVNLLEFARTNLQCSQIGDKDFYFYTSPPRLILSDLKKSLASYDLIPAAYVYLGHRTISPLQIDLQSNVRRDTINEANAIVSQYVFKQKPSEMNRTGKRNTTATNLDDKQLRDKLQKFLPGKK